MFLIGSNGPTVTVGNSIHRVQFDTMDAYSLEILDADTIFNFEVDSNNFYYACVRDITLANLLFYKLIYQAENSNQIWKRKLGCSSST